MLHDPTILPDDLPVPQDDGAARHLTGAKLPDITLRATDGTEVDLAGLKGGVPSSTSIRAPEGPARRCRPVGTASPARVAARRNPARSAITLPS
jgi:hypothetical protein